MKEHEHPYWDSAKDAMKSALHDYAGYRSKGASIPKNAKEHHKKVYEEEHERLSNMKTDDTGAIPRHELDRYK